MYFILRWIALSAFATFLLGSNAFAAGTNWYTTSDGKWSLSPGPGNIACNCGEPDQSDFIHVSSSIALSTSFVVQGSLTVDIGATLTVNGNLTFNNGSSVTIDGTLIVKGNFLNKNNSNNVDFNGYVQIEGDFQNGQGGTSAVIDFGPGATISIKGSCSSSGYINAPGGYHQTGCTTGPLPVKLISFHAEQVGTEILVSWATASEKNFEYFSIERADEQLNWEEAGTVKGSGTSQTRIDYTFTDEHPGMIGIIYYRLKAVDFDGYTEYFQVAMVNYRAPKAWYISPNPVNDGDVVLMRNFAEDEVVMATLYSMSGSEILQEQISVTTDRFVITSNLNAGLYILKLKDSGGTKNIRFAVE
ncbi:T9SS type A sorting domain-containing protein [Chryseolinea sp. T2]|uniref:T9SS type A sorting domain-containing protein n=1 Tax=Chryseolinea sp. T2 TaxID=3129255 RepID=UPI00307822FB